MPGRTVLHYLQVLSGRELPQTQTTNAERGSLVSHLPGRKRIVEIGVLKGSRRAYWRNRQTLTRWSMVSIRSSGAALAHLGA